MTSKIKDRFFLEEIIFRLKNNQMDYVETLTNDWMREMVRENPVTERERKKIIKQIVEGGHFGSEKELKQHIGF